jgi:hypothetical protein
MECDDPEQDVLQDIKRRWGTLRGKECERKEECGNFLHINENDASRVKENILTCSGIRSRT